MLASQLLLVQFFSEVLLSKAEPADCANRHRSVDQGQQAVVMINFRIMVSRVGAPRDYGDGKRDHKVRQALRFV
jgi:hypothetical protein